MPLTKLFLSMLSIIIYTTSSMCVDTFLIIQHLYTKGGGITMPSKKPAKKGKKVAKKPAHKKKTVKHAKKRQ